MTLSLHALRVFAATASAGSVSKAAAAVHRTPSAVSMTLKQLEAEIGRPLFEGERKGALTPTGRAVLVEAQAALDRFDRAEAMIRAQATGAAGRLAIAAVPSVAERLLPEALIDFRARYPAVAIDLFDTDSRHVAAEVADGAADLGMAGAPNLDEQGKTLEFRPLFRDALGLICRADDPLSGERQPIGWTHLSGRTLLTHGVSPLPPEHQPDARGSVATRTVTSALALVRAGLGVTILPRLAAPGADPSLVFVPMSPEAAPPRTVGMLTRAGESLSPPAERFAADLGASLDRLVQRIGAGFERLG